MWVRLKKLGLPNKLYLSIFVVPIIIFYIVTGELKLLTNKYEIKSKETKINEVCMHGLLYDARFMKKDKVIFLDSAIIEVNEINNSNFKTIYYTNKSGYVPSGKNVWPSIRTLLLPIFTAVPLCL